MICILAANKFEAEQWARGQFLAKNEYFCPDYEEMLLSYTNFHVITLESFWLLPSSFAERIFTLAQERGSKGRR